LCSGVGVLQSCLNVARAGGKKILIFLSFMRTEMFRLNQSEVCAKKKYLFFYCFNVASLCITGYSDVTY
jgi:hypothetical protein